MSEPADPTEPEARLFDIVVEEVSLVDQAANKRQFLIIKRARDAMAKSTTSNSEGQSKDGGAATNAGALDALERVAKAVGEAADEIDDPSDIARLVAIAEQLNELVASVVDEEEEEEDEEEEEEADAEKNAAASPTTAGAAADEPTRPPTPLAATPGRSKFEEAFAKVEAAIASLKTKAKEAPPSPSPTPTADSLSKVLSAIAELSADIKSQAQRLGRLEKGVGLPSSQPTNERGPRAREAEVSWPLDMNAPVGRGSVDKTVSFHDD